MLQFADTASCGCPSSKCKKQKTLVLTYTKPNFNIFCEHSTNMYKFPWFGYLCSTYSLISVLFPPLWIVTPSRTNVRHVLFCADSDTASLPPFLGHFRRLEWWRKNVTEQHRLSASHTHIVVDFKFSVPSQKFYLRLPDLKYSFNIKCHKHPPSLAWFWSQLTVLP